MKLVLLLLLLAKGGLMVKCVKEVERVGRDWDSERREGLRSSGKEGRQSAENRGESRTEHCGSQSTVTYGVRFESLGKTRLLKIYSAGGTKNSGGHTFLI